MEHKTEFQRTAGSAGLIGIIAFGGALVSFVLQLLVAYYFGASAQTDAYFMALSTSELLSKLLLGGSITAVFLPLFVEKLTHNDKKSAWELALNVLNLSALLFIVLLTLIAIFTRPFVAFIAPGFDGVTRDLTVNILRIILPAFLFLFLVEMATAMLYSLKQFALPAWLRVIAPLVSIVVVVTLTRTVGIYALAIGTVLGSIVQILFLGWGLKQQGLSYRLYLNPLDPLIKRLVHLVYPFIFSVLVTQGAGIVYRVLVSGLLAGSLTALKFAEKITQLMTIIFLTSITTVIYPLLSEKASRRDYGGMRDTIGSAVRLISLITVPLIIGIVMLRYPLITFIFQRGSFTPEAVELTSTALLFLALGLTTNGISSVLGHATLALQRTRAAVTVTIASQLVAITLFYLLVPRMGHAGLALASSLVPISIALFYFFFLIRSIPQLHHVFWHRTYLKIMILGVLLIATLQLTSDWLTAVEQVLPLAGLVQLVIPALIGSVVYFGGCYLWHIPEMHELIAIAAHKIKKLR